MTRAATEVGSPMMLDRLVEHLRSRDVVHDGQECPVAILWTDPKPMRVREDSSAYGAKRP